MATKQNSTKLSKSLSCVLRHRAGEMGLTMSPDGFITVSDILEKPQFRGYRVNDVENVVANCPKQRFELSERDGMLVIRARQGHSIRNIDFDSMMERIINPVEIPICIHGTYLRHKQSIRRSGLKRMGRAHVHMIPNIPSTDEVISGMRTTCDLYVVINVEEAMKAGIVFYRSSNNVILSPGLEPDGCIPPKFLSFHTPDEFSK